MESSVKEGNYLSTSQSAQPPSLEASGVLFQDSKNIALSKSKLVRSFRDIVVQGTRFHTFLLQQKYKIYALPFIL